MNLDNYLWELAYEYLGDEDDPEGATEFVEANTRTMPTPSPLSLSKQMFTAMSCVINYIRVGSTSTLSLLILMVNVTPKTGAKSSTIVAKTISITLLIGSNTKCYTRK